MTDLTPVLNELLKGHDARPTADPSLTLQNIDEFLKEAYKIVSLLCNFGILRLILLVERAFNFPQHISQRHSTILPFYCPSSAAEQPKRQTNILDRP